jgi:SAM-dependent methyltransferase
MHKLLKTRKKNQLNILHSECCLLFLFALVLCLPAHAGLIGHWTFDDTLNDSAGAANGSFSDGSPTYVAGKIENAVTLDGINDHVVLGTSSDFNFGSSADFSIAFWIKTTGTSSDVAIISNKDWQYGANLGYVIQNSYGSGRWGLNFKGADADRVDVQSDRYINDNQWHHLCVTFDRDGMATLYFDGTFDEQVSIAGQGNINTGFPTVLGIDGLEGANWPYWMPGDFDDLRIYDHVLTQTEIDQLQGTSSTVQIDVGPYVQFASPHTAVVRWDTSAPADSIVEYGLSESTLDSRVHIPDAASVHEIVLDDIHIKDKYFYRVGYTDGDEEQFTDVFWFDNNINYSRIDVSDAASPYEIDSLTPLYEQAAEHIVTQTGITKGICLVYGCGEGRLAFELAKRTDMMIVGVDTDSAKIDTAAQKLIEANVYGARVTVRHVTSLDNLPFTKYIANLIVSDHIIASGQCIGSAEEMFRILRPSGGVAYLGQPPDCPVPLIKDDLESWLDTAGLAYTIENDSSGLWAKVVRPDLPGAGWWSHAYGGPDAAGNSNDSLQGGRGTGDFDLQWVSWPGADAKVDRQVRAQSPISKNGRMVYRGFNRLITLDTYNGSIMWSLEVPGLNRFNIPRDSGWFCIDDDSVYVAVDDDCWQLDGDTGLRTLTHKLNDPGFD